MRLKGTLNRKAKAKYLYCTSHLVLPLQGTQRHNHRCVRIPQYFGGAGFGAQWQHPHLSDLQGTATPPLLTYSTTTPRGVHVPAAPHREVPLMPGTGGLLLPFTGSPQLFHAGRFPALSSALLCPVQGTVCAPWLNTAQMSCLRAGQAEGRKGCCCLQP